MFKQKMVQQAVQNLQSQITLVHTSQYAYSPREVPKELRCFKYFHRDVLEIINNENLHLAYQRWRMMSGGYEDAIAPIRRVHQIMTQNSFHLKCDFKLVQEIKRTAEILKMAPEQIFSRMMAPFPDFWCNADTMVGMLNIMCTTGMRLK